MQLGSSSKKNQPAEGNDLEILIDDSSSNNLLVMEDPGDRVLDGSFVRTISEPEALFLLFMAGVAAFLMKTTKSRK